MERQGSEKEGWETDPGHASEAKIAEAREVVDGNGDEGDDHHDQIEDVPSRSLARLRQTSSLSTS